jgi:hypothetical protein
MTDDIRELWPDPPETLRDRLQHFTDNWPDVPDATVVVMATSGVYGVGVLTGLTMGDIRTLAGREALGPETVVYGPEAERLGRQLREKLARDGRGRFQKKGDHDDTAPDQGQPEEGHWD